MATTARYDEQRLAAAAPTADDLTDWQLAGLLGDTDLNVRLAAERALFGAEELERQQYRAWCAGVLARRAARPVVVQPEPMWSPYPDARMAA